MVDAVLMVDTRAVVNVLTMKTYVRGSLQREREQQMFFDHIRSTTSCKIACILVQVLLPSGICKSRQPFPLTCFLLIFHGGFFWRRLLLIVIAVVAIILGHEMACLASDAVSLLVY